MLCSKSGGRPKEANNVQGGEEEQECQAQDTSRLYFKIYSMTGKREKTSPKDMRGNRQGKREVAIFVGRLWTDTQLRIPCAARRNAFSPPEPPVEWLRRMAGRQVRPDE